MELPNNEIFIEKVKQIKGGISHNINDYRMRKCLYCKKKTWKWTLLWNLIVSGGYSDWLWLLEHQKPIDPIDISLCQNKDCPSRVNKSNTGEDFSTCKNWVSYEYKNFTEFPFLLKHKKAIEEYGGIFIQ